MTATTLACRSRCPGPRIDGRRAGGVLAAAVLADRRRAGPDGTTARSSTAQPRKMLPWCTTSSPISVRARMVVCDLTRQGAPVADGKTFVELLAEMVLAYEESHPRQLQIQPILLLLWKTMLVLGQHFDACIGLMAPQLSFGGLTRLELLKNKARAAAKLPEFSNDNVVDGSTRPAGLNPKVAPCLMHAPVTRSRCRRLSSRPSRRRCITSTPVCAAARTSDPSRMHRLL